MDQRLQALDEIKSKQERKKHRKGERKEYDVPRAASHGKNEKKKYADVGLDRSTFLTQDTDRS